MLFIGVRTYNSTIFALNNTTMPKVAISGDNVAITSLNIDSRELVETEIWVLVKELNRKFDAYTRIVKGDYLECVILNSSNDLRIARAIKSLIKPIIIV